MRRKCALWLHYPEHPDSGFLIDATATTPLSDPIKEHPENRAETRQGLQFLNAQKLGDHEAEIEKIKSVLFWQLMKKMMEQTGRQTD